MGEEIKNLNRRHPITGLGCQAEIPGSCRWITTHEDHDRGVSSYERCEPVTVKPLARWIRDHNINALVQGTRWCRPAFYCDLLQICPACGQPVPQIDLSIGYRRGRGFNQRHLGIRRSKSRGEQADSTVSIHEVPCSCNLWGEARHSIHQ